jgi:hypothetical protein
VLYIKCNGGASAGRARRPYSFSETILPRSSYCASNATSSPLFRSVLKSGLNPNLPNAVSSKKNTLVSPFSILTVCKMFQWRFVRLDVMLVTAVTNTCNLITPFLNNCFRTRSTTERPAVADYRAKTLSASHIGLSL